MVLAGGESGYLQIWDLINVQEVCRITAHEGTLVTSTDCGLLVHRHNWDNFDKFSELVEYVNIGLARVLFHLYEKRHQIYIYISIFYSYLSLISALLGSSRFMFGVVQSYPWIEFYFPLFLNMVIYDNEFKTKENKV